MEFMLFALNILLLIGTLPFIMEHLNTVKRKGESSNHVTLMWVIYGLSIFVIICISLGAFIFQNEHLLDKFSKLGDAFNILGIFTSIAVIVTLVLQYLDLQEARKEARQANDSRKAMENFEKRRLEWETKPRFVIKLSFETNNRVNNKMNLAISQKTIAFELISSEWEFYLLPRYTHYLSWHKDSIDFGEPSVKDYSVFENGKVLITELFDFGITSSIDQYIEIRFYYQKTGKEVRILFRIPSDMLTWFYDIHLPEIKRHEATKNTEQQDLGLYPNPKILSEKDLDYFVYGYKNIDIDFDEEVELNSR